MNQFAPKPRRLLRHDILSLLPLGILLAALILLFPFGIFEMKHQSVEFDEKYSRASCAFVELTAETEMKAMEVVRSALSVDSSSIRELRADLSLSTIPEQVLGAIMNFHERSVSISIPAPIFDFLPLPSSLAAPLPVQIPMQAPESQKPTFSKEEMLKLID